MAVPKAKTSYSVQRMRSASKKVAVHVMTLCETCGDWRRPHHMCSHCGHYGGRLIMTPKAIRRQQAAQRDASSSTEF